MSASRVKYTNMEYPEYDAHWRYQSLPEPQLSAELTRLAGATRELNTDYVTFQPCPNPEENNQDRVVIQNWDLPSGNWKFRAVLDGHAGHDTADWTASRLPFLIQQSLEQYTTSNDSIATQAISDILLNSISTLDDDLTKELLGLFPSPDFIESLSDDHIRNIINDQESGGVNATIVARCMRGTTVLVSLIDPGNENIWTASLGDCQAVLGVRDESTDWQTSLLSGFHNGSDPSEQARIRSEHPGENQCVLGKRVLGAIAVTRAVGDHLFKLPIIYTRRVFMNAKAGFQFHKNADEFLNRNITPPYLSNLAETHHATIKGKEACLILCSDGLLDLYKHETADLKRLGELWFKVLSKPFSEKSENINLANYLLRHGLGGDDTEKVSRLITVEMEDKWLDDVSIVVERLSQPV